MKKSFVVAINAASGGGKTTITKGLQGRRPNSKALFLDDRNYDSDSGIDGICTWIEAGEYANMFNLGLPAKDLDKLIEGKPL